MCIATKPITVEEFLYWPDDGLRHELVMGEVTNVSPGSSRHGFVISRLNRLIEVFVEQHKLGAVFGAETGFVLARNPDTVLAPDVAFVRRARLAVTRLSDSFFEGPPDLAVEVMSPSDSRPQAEKKAKQWLEHGAREVWIVNPKSKSISVLSHDHDPQVCAAADQFSASEILSGLTFAVRDLFAELF